MIFSVTGIELVFLDYQVFRPAVNFSVTKMQEENF
jgi:hypothetical protein